MNKLDSQVAAGALAAAGYELVDEPSEADVVIFNTCSVRKHAEDKVLSYLGHVARFKKERPDMIVVVAGCMAQRLKQHLLDEPRGIDLVVGTGRLGEMVELIDQARMRNVLATGSRRREAPQRDVRFRTGPFQAYVAVMRGCDNFCSYCIVPYVRGRVESRPVADVVEEVQRLAADGVLEVTLLGQNAASYGKGESFGLAELLEAVDGVAGLERIRFVTCHPGDMTRDILSAVGTLPKVCPHLHMPAQSGSDRVLARMKRGYTRGQYLEVVAAARELIPGVTIAGDFIVGYPGETGDDFERTVSLVREVGLSNAFIFKYSIRPGTAAACLADDVPFAEKRRRNNELLAVQSEVSRAWKLSRLGEVEEVLVERVSPRDAGKVLGRTGGFEIVAFEGSGDLAGSIVPVRLTGATDLVYFGEPLEVREDEVSQM